MFINFRIVISRMSKTEMSRDRIAEEKAKHLSRTDWRELWNVDPSKTVSGIINRIDREDLSSNVADDLTLYPDEQERVFREPSYSTENIWGYSESPETTRRMVKSSSFIPLVARTTANTSDEFILTSNYSESEDSIIAIGGDVCGIDRLLYDLQKDESKQFPVMTGTTTHVELEKHNPADEW